VFILYPPPAGHVVASLAWCDFTKFTLNLVWSSFSIIQKCYNKSELCIMHVAGGCRSAIKVFQLTVKNTNGIPYSANTVTGQLWLGLRSPSETFNYETLSCFRWTFQKQLWYYIQGFKLQVADAASQSFADSWRVGIGRDIRPQVTVTVTICGDAYPLSCISAEAYKLAQCTRPQGWGS